MDCGSPGADYFSSTYKRLSTRPSTHVTTVPLSINSPLPLRYHDPSSSPLTRRVGRPWLWNVDQRLSEVRVTNGYYAPSKGRWARPTNFQPGWTIQMFITLTKSDIVPLMHCLQVAQLECGRCSSTMRSVLWDNGSTDPLGIVVLLNTTIERHRSLRDTKMRKQTWCKSREKV